jgi:hypothetical protein
VLYNADIINITKESLNNPLDLWERKFHSAKLHNYNRRKILRLIMTKKQGGASSTHGREGNGYKVFLEEKKLWEETTWET